MFRQFLDPERARKVLLQPGNSACHPVAVTVGNGDVDQLPARRPRQDAIEDFLFDQRRERRDITWTIEQAHKANGSIQKLGRGDIHHDTSLIFARPHRLGKPVSAHQIEHLFAADRNGDTEVRNLGAGFDDPPRDGKFKRGQKVVASAVIDRITAELNAFRTLNHHRETRPIASMARFTRRCPPADSQPFDCRRTIALVFRVTRRDRSNFLIGIERECH
ncbi:hypothetical protein D3C71_1600250 [compost metagenome]